MQRTIVRVAVLIAVLLAFVVPTSQARQASSPVSPADPVDLPPALAQAGIAPSAWGRMVDQIRAQQPLNGCPSCEGGAVEFAEDKKLLASDGAFGDQFGFSVAIWGDTVVIGAYTASPGGIFRQGAAWVFGRNVGGADNWGEIKKLTASDGAAYDYFGVSVAIWGDTIAVGACEANASASDQGAAYVFARNTGGADNWGQVKKLTASDAGSQDFFGRAVAVWGDTVVVGAWFDDVGPNGDQGSAYVFGRNTGGADNWGEVKKVTTSDGGAGDYSGLFVAIWGDTVVVGAYAADASYGDQGAAYIFERNAGGADNWGQVKKLVAADGQSGDHFGIVVAIYGDTVVAGASGDDITFDGNEGAAYVFERNAGGANNWGEVKKLIPSDAASESFGFAASIWGDTVVVGAYLEDVEGMGNRGAVYVFARNFDPANPGTPLADNWGEVDRLITSDGVDYDYFGWYVDIWGDTVVAGAYGADVGDNRDQGAAYLFTAPCTPESELKKETAVGGAAGDQFGYSVAGWDDTVVVGALYHSLVSGNRQGAAYVFSRNAGGVDNWGLVKGLVAGDGENDDFFGISVAIWGDTLVVGAHSDDVEGRINQGSVYLFQRNAGGADNWGQVKQLLAAGGAGNDEFGRSVAIWDDTVVVGANQDTVGSNNSQGSAYVFSRNAGGANGWGQVKQLTVSDGAAWDHFGQSVTIWGDAIVVGAPNSGVGSYVEPGAAYVFARNAGGADNWGQVKQLLASDGLEFDHFGISVAIWGPSTVVVGACDNDVGVHGDQGSAYVFARNQGGADNWGEVKQLTALDGAVADQFGGSVSIWGDTILIGAANHLGQGRAYLFESNLGGTDNWGQAAGFTSSDAQGGERFGDSVRVWGNNAIVGARFKTVAGNANQGAAYLLGCAGSGSGDVSITKVGEPDLVRRGDTLTYTLSYTGTSCPNTGVTVTDTLPAGVSFGAVVSAPAGWTGPNVVGQVVSWYTPTLANCATGSLVFTAVADLSVPVSPDWILTNAAIITATGDLTPTNNLSQAMSVVQGLEIRKSHFPATVTAAWDFWFYIDVTNTASSPATNLVVTDTLPVGVAAYSVQPDPGGVFDGVNTVVWTIPSLGPNATMRLTLKARTYSTQAGNCLTNLAVADSEQAAPAVHTEHTFCVVKGELTRPTPTPTPAATPVPPGTTVVIKKGGPGTSLDTYIYRNQPYSNYWLEPLLKVGYKQTNAALIQFDLSPIPAGAKVDEAWLEVWAAGWSGPFSNMTIGAYAISETVQISQTTWVSPELGSTWSLAGANDVVLDRRPLPESTVTTTGPLLWYRFDVSKLVQEWLDGGTANNGAMLRCESCMGRGVKIGQPEDSTAPVVEDADVELAPPIDEMYPMPMAMPGNLCTYTFFFASSEYSDATRWPRLVVRYE